MGNDGKESAGDIYRITVLDRFLTMTGSAIRNITTGFLLGILFLSPRHGIAQERSIFSDSLFLEIAEDGLNHQYNLEFEQALSKFEQVKDRYPDHPVGPFLDGLTIWWRILVELSNEELDKKFNGKMKEVMKASDRRLKRDQDDLDGLFFKAIAYSFRGRLHSNRKHWIRGARDGKRAVDLVIKLAEIDAENDDLYFGWGVYDYFAAVIPEQKRFLKPFMRFFPNSDKERGIAELTRTFEYGRFMKAEAAYFLFQIYYIYEPNIDKALFYITWLRVRYPRNSLFRILEARAHIRFYRWNDALPILEKVVTDFEAGEVGFTKEIGAQAIYFLGLSRMRVGDYRGSLPQFKKLRDIAATASENMPYGVLGRLREGMAFDRLGYRDAAKMRYREVIKLKDISDSKKRAKAYMKKAY